jgi:hypothetical protein
MNFRRRSLRFVTQIRISKVGDMITIFSHARSRQTLIFIELLIYHIRQRML